MMGRIGLISNNKAYKYATHILDNVSPDLLLDKIFHVTLFISRSLGVLPLKIGKDGKASCKICSWEAWFTIFGYWAFIMDSCLLIPMYAYLINGASGSQQVMQVAQVMFISCQYLGAGISYLILPFMVPKFISFWNKIQATIARTARLTGDNRQFLGTYRGARLNMRIWLVTSCSFSFFCIYSYGDGFDSYMGTDTHPLIYWAMYAGFCCFPFVLSYHILHTLIFITLCSSLTSCFSSLKKHCEGITQDKFGDTTSLYEEIVAGVEELGRVGGVHVVIEVLIMIICVTMNIFFLLGKFNEVNGKIVYLAVLLPYCLWFHYICTSGDALHKEGKECCQAVKKLNCKDPANYEWKLLKDPEPVSANGYFYINMRLFTTVMGTIATYLIVLLQFKGSQAIQADFGCNCTEH